MNVRESFCIRNSSLLLLEFRNVEFRVFWTTDQTVAVLCKDFCISFIVAINKPDCLANL